MTFKYRSHKEWFRSSSVKAFLRVIFSEMNALILHKSQLQISSSKLFATVVLSRKHARAWERGLDDSIDGILILEDDAMLNLSKQKLLAGALTFLESKEPIFINFGTGNVKNRYRFEDYLDNGDITLWKKARFADTTCAYFMNKVALRLVLDAYHSQKCLDSLGIDFVLSDIFIKDRNIEVLHLDEPVFKNGSLVGVFTSQIDSHQNL